MIRRIDSLESTDIRLRNSHYARIILSHMMTYGTEYDFCEFYELMKSGKRIGVFACLNGSMTADILDGASLSSGCIRESDEFIRFKSPYFAEMPPELYSKMGISEYQRIKRCFFKVTPGQDSSELNSEPYMETVFATAFNGKDEHYGLWLTDTVRRRNKDITRVYSYHSSVLTVRCRSNGMAYITDVATPEADRGKGYARTLLGKTAFQMRNEGYECYLTADESTWDYYRSLGYEEIGNDIILKLKDKKNYEQLF